MPLVFVHDDEFELSDAPYLGGFGHDAVGVGTGQASGGDERLFAAFVVVGDVHSHFEPGSEVDAAEGEEVRGADVGAAVVDAVVEDVARDVQGVVVGVDLGDDSRVDGDDFGVVMLDRVLVEVERRPTQPCVEVVGDVDRYGVFGSFDVESHRISPFTVSMTKNSQSLDVP